MRTPSLRTAESHTASIRRQLGDPDDARLRVLFVSGIRGMSGAEIVLARFIENNSDLDTAVFLPGGPLYERLRRSNARLYRSRGLRQLERHRSILWPLVFVARCLMSTVELLCVCRKERPDVMHAAHFAAALYCLPTSRLLNIRLTWHIHDIFPDRALEYRICRAAAAHVLRIVAVSNAVRTALIRNGVPEEAISVIHNGIDADNAFNPALYAGGSVRRRCGIPSDVLTVGMIGLLVEWKGAHIFIEAIARLTSRLPGNVRFLIIGGSWQEPSPYKESLIEMVRRRALDHLVSFTGRLANMPEVLTDLNVVVHCSIAPDPLPTVILEAQAMGKLVIATSAGGVPEMIEDGVTGLLYPPGDAQQLAALLERVISEYESFAPLGVAARASVRERFRDEAQREAFLRVWQQPHSLP